MIALEEALALTCEHALAPASETLSLADAVGRRLTADVAARHSQPPMDVSVMDGYAARAQDIRTGAELNVVGESKAGQGFPGILGPGEAVRIFTGAPVPQGADRVVMQENATRVADTLRIDIADGPAFIRPEGRDFAHGDVLATAGTRLTPGHVTALSAAGHAEVDVRAPLRVGLLRGGDELRPAGTPLAPGQIADANGPGLTALLRSWGHTPVDLGIVPDDPDSIGKNVKAALGTVDVLVPIGGASVGDHDHMQAVMRELGAEPVFSKVAVKPGKPVWLSRLGNVRVLGLPGNPGSAWVCAHIFLVELLGEPLPTTTLPLGADLAAGGGRAEYLRATVRDGRLFPVASQDSGLTRTIARADALIPRAVGAETMTAGQNARAILID